MRSFILQSFSEQKTLIPRGFDDELLQHYIAYKNELRTRQLVRATWALAGASIILSGLTLYLQFVSR